MPLISRALCSALSCVLLAAASVHIASPGCELSEGSSWVVHGSVDGTALTQAVGEGGRMGDCECRARRSLGPSWSPCLSGSGSRPSAPEASSHEECVARQRQDKQDREVAVNLILGIRAYLKINKAAPPPSPSGPAALLAFAVSRPSGHVTAGIWILLGNKQVGPFSARNLPLSGAMQEPPPETRLGEKREGTVPCPPVSWCCHLARREWACYEITERGALVSRPQSCGQALYMRWRPPWAMGRCLVGR